MLLSGGDGTTEEGGGGSVSGQRQGAFGGGGLQIGVGTCRKAERNAVSTGEKQQQLTQF